MGTNKVCIYCKRSGRVGYERDPHDEAWQCASVGACGRRADRERRHVLGR